MKTKFSYWRAWIRRKESTIVIFVRLRGCNDSRCPWFMGRAATVEEPIQFVLDTYDVSSICSYDSCLNAWRTCKASRIPLRYHASNMIVNTSLFSPDHIKTRIMFSRGWSLTNNRWRNIAKKWSNLIVPCVFVNNLGWSMQPDDTKTSLTFNNLLDDKIRHDPYSEQFQFSTHLISWLQFQPYLIPVAIPTAVLNRPAGAGSLYIMIAQSCHWSALYWVSFFVIVKMTLLAKCLEKNCAFHLQMLSCVGQWCQNLTDVVSLIG